MNSEHASMPPGVEVRLTDEEAFDAWLDVVTDGFARPDTQGVVPHEELPRDVIARAERDFAAADVVRYLAMSYSVSSVKSLIVTSRAVSIPLTYARVFRPSARSTMARN
jgi:hypothetical protein